MPNTIFAIALGALALYGVYAAVRAEQSRRRMGWGLIALAAAAQAVNLLMAYSMVLAIVSTVGLLAGFWFLRIPSASSRDD